MKQIILSTIIIFVFTTLSFSQTEVWRNYLAAVSRYTDMKKDTNGNIYWNTLGFDSEIIKKINQNGNTVWSKSFNDVLQIRNTGSGFYIIDWNTNLFHINFTIYFYNTSGIKVWEKFFDRTWYNFSSCDESGNLMICYRTVNYGSWITKYNKEGGEIFHLNIPQLKEGKSYVDLFNSSGIEDSNNRVWILGNLSVNKEKNTETSYYSLEKIYLYLVIMDKTSGEIIVKKKLPSIYHEEDKNKEDGGRRTEYHKEENFENANDENIPFLSADNLCIWGDNELYISNEKPKSFKEFEAITWRLITVNSKGNFKNFTHKGNGLITYKERDEVDSITYAGKYFEHRLYGVSGNEGGYIYLTGFILRGKAVNELGEVYEDGVLMKYNPTSKKIVWKKTFLNNSATDVNVDRNGNVYVRLSNFSKRLYVFDSNGNGPDSITFNDPVYSIPKYATLDSGYVYLLMRDSVGTYLGKFTLPTFKFASNFVNQNEAERFFLAQNYPNPFNPTTAISFSLLAVSNITLKVYNVLGQEVATLLNSESLEEGKHEIQFDASGLTSGVYFYRLIVADEKGKQVYSETKKLLLMK
ncbi:MAG: T9SS type A sorting domain-containing protein [Ignavibacteriales bacterium]|nr:T9SS type A sorting domain-containing protein [Ignavibacteriales bacterium]